MKLEPLFDRVVVSPIAENEKTKGGILLPNSAQEKPQMGKVIAIGSGINLDGDKIPMQVNVGDTVIYSKYAGSEFKIDGEILILIRQTELLGILR
ncbi:MAG: co-chaperone GroES [Clostridia bacterium]